MANFGRRGFGRIRSAGGGGGEATVANIHQIGETRLGLQFALDEGGADWLLLVDFRDADPITVVLDEDVKTATLFYDQMDTQQEVLDALESISGISATLIAGSDPNAILEPHFVAGRPFLAGEPYGQYTEAYTPAVALFEHPVPATALFEAVDGGADGLTVTLGEPLEYGLDVNNWGISGHQRYQGTPDTPERFSSVTASEFTDTDDSDFGGVTVDDDPATPGTDVWFRRNTSPVFYAWRYEPSSTVLNIDPANFASAFEDYEWIGDNFNNAAVGARANVITGAAAGHVELRWDDDTGADRNGVVIQWSRSSSVDSGEVEVAYSAGFRQLQVTVNMGGNLPSADTFVTAANMVADLNARVASGNGLNTVNFNSGGPFADGADISSPEDAGVFADQDAVEEYLSRNPSKWTRRDAGHDLLYYDIDEGDVRKITAFAPATAAEAATVDLPTSAAGGIRITWDTPGAAANGITMTTSARSGVSPLVITRSITTRRLEIQPGNGADASDVLAAINDTTNVQGFGHSMTAAYYGTENGTTVITQNGSFTYAEFGGSRLFEGGSDAVYLVDAVPGEPDEPIHIILDPDARDTSMLDEEVFPTGQSAGSGSYLGQFDNDAAATAAIGGATTAVYLNRPSLQGRANLPLRQTTNGGASWASQGVFQNTSDTLGVYPIINNDFPLFAAATTANISHADEAAAAGVAVAANLDPSRTYFYYSEATSELMLVQPGIFKPSPAIEVYYNRAAGGRLAGPDTLEGIFDFIDTHFEGLTAEYAGSADANTLVTRPFANRSAFSGGSLNGLQILLDRPLAIGADGNDWTFQARERFAGGAEQTERQAHVLIYTNIGRNGGVRLDLEAGIQGLNQHGVPVDVSSGALGNEWSFTAVEGTAQFADVVTFNTAEREIIYYTPVGQIGTEAQTFLAAAQMGGNGVSAHTFGNYHPTSSPFFQQLGRINIPQQFHNGRNYHPASPADPLAVTVGPANATTRIYTRVDGGVEVELLEPPGDQGNGWQIVETEGAAVSARYPHSLNNTRQIELSIPPGGASASGITGALSGPAEIDARYFGTEDGSTRIMRGDVGRLEFLGGLDAREIEIEYAYQAGGNIANPDTMGDVMPVIDAVPGLSSFLYGGADAATTANRVTPWEHEFEGGDSEDFDLTSFALGPAQNVFTGSTRADAEAARDAYANANPSWVVAYRGNASLWISLRWDNGGQIGQILRENASNPPVAGDWVDQALALKGEKGDKGDAGTAYADGSSILGTGELTDRFRVGDIDAKIDARIQTQVKGYAQVGGPLIMPGDADTAFMLDAEFNVGAIRTLLGFTQAEQDSLLRDDNARIENNVLIIPRLDGTEVRLTLPQQMAGTADGVIDGFSFAADLSSLTITRSEGADIVVSIPPGLRAVPRTDPEINALIDARRGNRIMLSTATTYDDANDLLEGNAPFVPVLGDRVTFLVPANIVASDDALSFRARAGDASLPFHDRDGNDVSTRDIVAGRLYELVRFSAEYRILESPSESEPPPAGMHLRYFGWKAAGAIVTADLDDSLARTNSSTTDEGEYPANNVQATRWFAVPESEGEPTEHYLPPNPLNTIIGFSRQAGTIDDANGEAHIVMVATAQTVITATPTDVRIGHN